jgi:hypothetical protein
MTKKETQLKNVSRADSGGSFNVITCSKVQLGIEISINYIGEIEILVDYECCKGKL